MSERPDNIRTALCIRSYEKVFVISGADQLAGDVVSYPEDWVVLSGQSALSEISIDSVVIIDRTQVRRSTLETIGRQGPRLVAFAPDDREQEKAMRRLLKMLYPWAETWDFYTTFGKVFVSNGVNGEPYSRDEVVDMRPAAAA